MKTKIFSIIILFFLGGLFINAKVNVNDIEYLKGENFVQLHFKTEKEIPIPALFYPNEDNGKFLVMRIDGVDFKLDKDVYQFESTIVDYIKIKKGNDYVDVEINLKESVTSRVFSNKNGLYVEFPELKKAKSDGKSPSIKKRENVEPIKEKKDEKSTYMPLSGRQSKLKGIHVVKKGKDRVKFKLVMSEKVDYKVIPIHKTPARLAIDLINLRSSNWISKKINHLNVKGIRGAPNSPSVYRLVFDLLYLKNYNVLFADNNLEVEFFDHGFKSNKDLMADSKQIKNKVPRVIKADKVTKPDTQKIIVAKATTITDTPSKPVVDRESSKEKPIRLTPKSRLPRIIDNKVIESRPEFFTEERSKAIVTEKSNTVGQEDPQDTQVTYLDETVSEGGRKYVGEPFDFHFKDADLANVLIFFARESGLSIVIDPGVTGKITADMYQVPWDQALDYFLKINRLEAVREGNLLRIGKIEVLSREAEERRKMRDARRIEENLIVKTRSLSYADALQVSIILRKQLTKRGEIVVDKRTNLLIITEVPYNLKILEKLIDTLDAATQQVSIEARIVETSTNFTENLGIQWGYNFMADARHGNQTTLKFPSYVGVSGDQIFNQQNPGLPSSLPNAGYAINLPAPGRTSGTVFSFGNVANTFRLDMALSALQKKGLAKIISSPKTTTQNNMEAEIMQGKQIPVQTIRNNTVTVVFKNAALELKVTPHITAEKTIVTVLDIKNNSADFGNLVNGIPPIITQSIKTTVMIKDGGTIVIGGMFRIEESKSIDSVPLLSKIPILGKLFKSSAKRSEQKELLIFITPRIVK